MEDIEDEFNSTVDFGFEKMKADFVLVNESYGLGHLIISI